jgi:endonuclease/exonuclease/phosphatase family metal-dependent hydrolase
MHLDTDASRVAQARFLASHLRSDPTGGLPLVVGGDLNSLRGTRDGAYRVMAEHLSEEPCGTGKTNVWPARLDVLHGWWRGRIDFLFRNTADLPQPYVCWTVRDRYGSDHRPVVMVVDLP